MTQIKEDSKISGEYQTIKEIAEKRLDEKYGDEGWYWDNSLQGDQDTAIVNGEPFDAVAGITIFDNRTNAYFFEFE